MIFIVQDGPRVSNTTDSGSHSQHSRMKNLEEQLSQNEEHKQTTENQNEEEQIQGLKETVSLFRLPIYSNCLT